MRLSTLRPAWPLFVLCAGLSACNVAEPAAGTGGALFDAAGACPAALVIASSDYVSTNITLTNPRGVVSSASIISSSSASVGLSVPLSGDVLLPQARPTSGEIVLIDAFPNSVLTWVDPSSAAVLRQLSVATGFNSNPHDYLEVAADKAYVTRYASNPSPGLQAHDSGGDVLVIDPRTSVIKNSIALTQATDGAFQPRPDRLLRVADEVWVSLQRFDADFKTASDARLVGITTATDALAWTLDVPGVANCGALARSPSSRVVALACTGIFGSAEPLVRSSLVLLDATSHPPRELTRFPAATALGAQLGATLAFASETLLVGTAYGDFATHLDDVAYTLDTSTAKIDVLYRAHTAFVLGDIRCAPGCTDLCLLTDAEADALRIWNINGGALANEHTLSVDPGIGLPPRAIGAL